MVSWVTVFTTELQQNLTLTRADMRSRSSYITPGEYSISRFIVIVIPMISATIPWSPLTQVFAVY